MLHPRQDVLDEHVELRAMAREHRGAVNLLRIRHLAERLERGPMAVQDSVRGFCGDRFILVLDSGERLRLKLLWPRHITAAALCSIRWDDASGWIVIVRSTAGEGVVLYCYDAALDLPQPTR
jgi:hypothetical protein